MCGQITDFQHLNQFMFIASYLIFPWRFFNKYSHLRMFVVWHISNFNAFHRKFVNMYTHKRMLQDHENWICLRYFNFHHLSKRSYWGRFQSFVGFFQWCKSKKNCLKWFFFHLSKILVIWGMFYKLDLLRWTNSIIL